MELYGCSICGTYFQSEEELHEHLETVHGISGDDVEGHILYLSGLTEDQAKEILRSQEREIESLQGLPRKEIEESYYYPYYHGPYGPYSYPQKYPYPYYPKYPYRTKIVYIYKSPKGYYYCAIHKQEFKTLQGLLKHLKEKHSTEDYIRGLKLGIREKYKRIAKLQGRTIREEELDKISDQELLGKMLREFFNEPEKIERLGNLIDSKLEDLKRYFKNETDICPICHQQLLEVDESLLSGFNIPKGIDKYITRITFLGEEIRADLRKVVHLASKHPITFRSLVENGFLSGTGIKTLLKNLSNREKSPKERAKENLMRTWIKSKDKSNKKLTKDDNILLWFYKDKHEKERTYSIDD